MAAPVKAITYLDGTFDQGPVVVRPRPPLLQGLEAQTLRQAPPMWKPVRYATAQDLAGTAVKVRPFSLTGFIGILMRPFWRDSTALGKGQQYP